MSKPDRVSSEDAKTNPNLIKPLVEELTSIPPDVKLEKITFYNKQQVKRNGQMFPIYCLSTKYRLTKRKEFYNDLINDTIMPVINNEITREKLLKFINSLNDNDESSVDEVVDSIVDSHK